MSAGRLIYSHQVKMKTVQSHLADDILQCFMDKYIPTRLEVLVLILINENTCLFANLISSFYIKKHYL